MLEGPSGDDRAPRATALPRDLARILEWCRGHAQEPVQLPALAEVAGVPARTLEAHFRRFLGVTPLTWVRQARLERVRCALLASDGRTSVSRVALDCGFTQLGRFAAQYSRRFGELPSETLQRIRHSRPDAFEDVDDEATRLAWRVLPAVFAVAPGPCSRAIDDLEQAQELAPSYAFPKALAAWCFGQRAAHHFSSTVDVDAARAVRLAMDVRRLAPTDALSLTLAAGALTLAHRLDEARGLLDDALALEPGSPWVWLRRAWASAYEGDAVAALRQFATTLHLMPFEPVRHLAFIGIGCAHFAAGRYDRAARWVQTGVEASPDSYWAARVAAAAAVHAGAKAEGRKIVHRLLRKDPSLTVRVARRAWPFPRAMMERVADGLAIAGMPRD
ncbi:MAG TPA: helix-turn-helix domain-containing protein [Anaeromyxobacter sp.]|nr:helix-turn-helix domain-containing protein [Anaeromyxobacter sp.]